MEVNEKCDVYSFGVLVLEVIMGKHLGEFISSLSSPSSSASSSSASPPPPPPTLLVRDTFLKDVLDQRLSSPTEQVAEELVFIAKLALACLHVSPQSQPTMGKVSTELSKQRPTMRNPFYMITIGQLFDIGSSSVMTIFAYF
ncbi:MDIS1-interacting receptor like kinase 2-like [Cornus florida]|uniref:MDIS1-interacting receptor like kinase 2-like n=1 Tax=Cornus florida TaxID=4283 RepID=UPI0028A04A92|nr:MDIS1-interacting receptor like kinase 2-like [Cornus florida]